MFSFGAAVLGVLWVSAGADAFLPILANVYMNGPGRAFGSAMSSSAPQTVCSWYNIPGYINTVPTQNSANAGSNAGWGSLWSNGRGNAWNNGWSNAYPGLMSVLNSMNPSAIRGSSGQSGRPGIAVRVEETDPRASGGVLSNANPPSTNTAGTRELDYTDQDAPYYYDGDDYYYYGQDYPYSASGEYVVYQLPRTAAPPTALEVLQTIYGSQFGSANTAGSDPSGGSNPCGACAASLLNMLMG